MQIALSAGTLHNRPLEEVAELAADAGFDGIEVIISSRFTVTQNQSQALLAQIQQILPVVSLHAPFFEVDGWGDKTQQLERTVDLALEAGVPLVCFHPPSWLALEWSFRRWLNRFDDIQAQLGQGQVMVTMENMPPGGPGYMATKPEAMLSYLEKINLHLTFDAAHMGAFSNELVPEFDRFYAADRVRNVHLSDYIDGREHLLPGTGGLPLEALLQRLGTSGYDQALVLELMPAELPDDRDSLVAELSRLVAWLRQETCPARPL